MSPRSNGFQAVSFDGGTSYEANEPLFVAAGDAEELEDHRLDEKAFSRFKFSPLLWGLLVGFFIQFSILKANLWVISTLWDGDLVTKSKTNIVVFSLLWSFFTAVMAIANLRFLRNMVTITYSAAGGRSKDLLEEMIWRMERRFGAGVCIAWTMTGPLWGMRAQTEFTLVLLVVALVSRLVQNRGDVLCHRHI